MRSTLPITCAPSRTRSTAPSAVVPGKAASMSGTAAPLGVVARLGHLLAETDRREEAHEALTLAIGLATDAAVRQYLHGKLAKLTSG